MALGWNSPVVNSRSAVGPWRSWERASMASRRSWVRIPSAPPNPQKRNKNVGSVITVAQLQKTADEISPALRFFQHATHFQSNGSSSRHRLSKVHSYELYISLQ